VNVRGLGELIALTRFDEAELSKAGHNPALGSNKRANPRWLPEDGNGYITTRTGERRAGGAPSLYPDKWPHAKPKIKLLTLLTASLITLREATVCPVFPTFSAARRANISEVSCSSWST
jgi:hypothetical protein